MLKNYILETSSAPGTAQTINLAGAQPGRVPFIGAFASGAECFYFLSDGVQAEAGIATVTSGSPNTLARNTVLWNSAVGDAAPGRLSFTGTTYVYNDVPAEAAIWRDRNGNVMLGSKVLYQLGAAYLADHATRYDQVAWHSLNGATISAAASSVVFSLPSDHSRFRLEWRNVTTSVAGGFLARFSFDGGNTFSAGSADYVSVGSDVSSAGVASLAFTSTYMALGFTNAPSWASTGDWEFEMAAKTGFCRMYGNKNTIGEAAYSGITRCAPGGTPTHVLFANGSANLNSGLFRLLGGY